MKQLFVLPKKSYNHAVDRNWFQSLQFKTVMLPCIDARCPSPSGYNIVKKVTFSAWYLIEQITGSSNHHDTMIIAILFQALRHKNQKIVGSGRQSSSKIIPSSTASKNHVIADVSLCHTLKILVPEQNMHIANGQSIRLTTVTGLCTINTIILSSWSRAISSNKTATRLPFTNLFKHQTCCVRSNWKQEKRMGVDNCSFHNIFLKNLHVLLFW